MKTALLFILLHLSTQSFAQVIQGPLSRALGGSGRAGIESSESALLNPALIPFAPDHEFNFFYGDGAVDSREHETFFGVGAVDNSEGIMIPGALHYMRFRDSGRGPTGISHEMWHFAVGRLAYQKFSVGVSAYRLMSDPDEFPSKVQWNGSVGVFYLISPALGVTYVLDNILEPSSSIPDYLRQTMKQSLGMMYSFSGMARFRFDVTREDKYNPDKKMLFQTGFEAASFEFVVLRFGGKWDNLREQNFVTTGIGFNGPRLKIDYTFEKNTKRTGDALHSVDMRVPF